MSHLDRYRRPKVVWHTKDFAHLVGLFDIPLVVTLEKPVAEKGSLPQEIGTFAKTFFDLTREPQIRDHIASLRRKQVIVAGCETDVCVLQSCLGLLSVGYEVYMVENLLFSASDNVDAALARMKAAGATFVTYKTLFYELAGSVDTEEKLESAGPVTKDLPD